MSAKEAEKEGRQLLGRPARLPVGSEMVVEDVRLRLGPFKNWFVVEQPPELESAAVITRPNGDQVLTRAWSEHAGNTYWHYSRVSYPLPQA